MQQPVAWKHETTCEFISDEMKREFPDTLFIRKCNIPLFGEPVIGTTEAVAQPSDIILRKQIDAQNVALQEAREEYAILKEQFLTANKMLLSRNERIKDLCEIIMDEYPDSDDRFQIASSTYSALGYFRDA